MLFKRDPNLSYENTDGSVSLIIDSTHHVIVDRNTLFLIDKHRIFLGDKGYPEFRIDGKRVRLHRLIMGASLGDEVDHEDRNKLNARKNNLRLATSSQNKMNREIQNNNTSGYKGVSWNK